MKKRLITLFSLPLLLLSCAGGSGQRQVTAFELAGNIKDVSVTKAATKSVGKFSGNRRSENLQLIGESNYNEKIREEVKYTYDPASRVITDTEGSQPADTLKPEGVYQMSFGIIVASNQPQAPYEDDGETLTYYVSSKFYVNPYRIFCELVHFQAADATHPYTCIRYILFDVTYNKDQWPSKIRRNKRISYFKDGQMATKIVETTATYSYTYQE